MKMMKRYMLGLALSALAFTGLAFSGLATADSVAQDLELKAAYMVQTEDHAVAFNTGAVRVAEQRTHERTGLDERMRSDMRVESAGLVFNRADMHQVIESLVPC